MINISGSVFMKGESRSSRSVKMLMPLMLASILLKDRRSKCCLHLYPPSSRYDLTQRLRARGFRLRAEGSSIVVCLSPKDHSPSRCKCIVQIADNETECIFDIQAFVVDQILSVHVSTSFSMATTIAPWFASSFCTLSSVHFWIDVRSCFV